MNKYTINGHGIILDYNDDRENSLFNDIIIPENVKINIFSELGERLYCTTAIQHITCGTKFKEKKDKDKLKATVLPRYKFKEKSKFPNILFASDDLSPKKTFYSGIVHCKTNKIIYNIDALSYENCICDKISSLRDKPYDCNKNYYKDYEPVTQECGPILLEDAIKKIQDHAKFIKDDKLIEINILSC